MSTVEDFEFWQTVGAPRPLTCGNDDAHSVLKPIESDVEGGIELVCVACDYRYVPDAALHELAAPIEVTFPSFASSCYFQILRLLKR